MTKMIKNPTDTEVNSLFANTDPEETWGKAAAIIARINPAYDFGLIRTVFDDVLRLFHGEYQGYSSIKTLYHNLPHTLDVFLCAVRLVHGMHLSGTRLSDEEISLIVIATLMHDIGYAQLEEEESGTGAQFTQTHVKRGITFMQHYLTERHLPASFAASLSPMIYSTDPSLNFAEIEFPDDRTRLLGQLVVTADLTGQMADRTYLEKLLFLYLEFKEAHFGKFRNIHDMLRQTRNFYEITRTKLDGPFGGLHINLALHFKDMLGVEKNYYLESIEKNIAYLEKIVTLDEAEHLTMLKRGGITEKAKAISVPE